MIKKKIIEIVDEDYYDLFLFINVKKSLYFFDGTILFFHIFDDFVTKVINFNLNGFKN